MTNTTIVLEGLNDDKITINRPTWMQQADMVQSYFAHQQDAPKYIIPIIAELVPDDLYSKAKEYGIDLSRYNNRASICAEVLVSTFGIMSVYKMVFNLMEKIGLGDSTLNENSETEKN